MLADIIFLFPLGSLNPVCFLWKSNSAQAGARGAYAALQTTVLYMKGLSEFRSFVCSLFPKATF